ncbi:TonB-dependent receptor [Parasphingopyxis algicola]|uniref:TonB-dependent receptor n=1 Tax=Parasphingopyxis algicola TaxID=2026624 RepID=UPI0015A2659E|nr:TonB-dependent receptor [Parasphingopyxis algicola]QLC24923.1 TonB-dependent receptor [Parasphingopyxis algicola]
MVEWYDYQTLIPEQVKTSSLNGGASPPNENRRGGQHMRGHFRKPAEFVLMLSASCSGLGVSAAWAQAEPAAEEEGNVIIVTANRREQNAQDIGIAVTAVGGDLVGSQNLVRAEQLDRLIPGFVASPNSGSSVSTFNIRGVGQSDFALHQEQPNAAYQDGVYIASADAIGAPLYDLQRVEVLRGPQSTLFGRNATGGLVQFVSNRPTYDFNGSFQATYGSENLVRLQGMVNGGLSNSVAARLAVYYQERDGFIENRIGDDLLAEQTFAARGQLAVELNEDTDFNLRIEGFDQEGNSFAGKHRVTFLDADGVSQFAPPPATDAFGFRDLNPDPTVVSVNQPGIIDKQVYNIAGTFTHDFGDVTLISISSYSDVDSVYLEDTDSSPFDNVNFGASANADYISQEIRLEESAGAFRWTAGVYYLDIGGDYTVFFDLPSSFARYDADYSLNTTSYAFFGQFEYDITDRLTFILGGRWTEDDQDFVYQGACSNPPTAPTACQDVFFLGLTPGLTDANGNPVVGDIGQFELNQSNGDWTGRIALEFDATDDFLLFASISKGLKTGGFTAPSDGLLSAQELAFEPEELFAYEAGFKSTLADGRVLFNSSVYYYDYDNFQTFEFSGITSTVLNRPAEAFGGEAELIVTLDPGFQANLGLSYNDFKVDNIVTPTSGPNGETQRPVNAPNWTANWTITKDFDLGGGLVLEALYGGRYTSSRFYNVVNVPVVRGGAFTLHDASLTLRSDSGWFAQVFANNITDEDYVNFSFDLTGFFANSLDHIGEGRVIGATLGFEF